MITVTDSARTKIDALIAEEGEEGQHLRIRVIPGGCSGFEYQMLLDAPTAEDDVADACVVIDRMSVPYLLGATLDYTEGFQAAGFQIINPNATGSCGCGKSFTA